jgi:prepilin-type N-terminal cleavage/methylation domain-containing protein
MYRPLTRRGFSLVESLVAIVLLGVGIVALEGALAISVRTAAAADRAVRAATLATRQRERAFALCSSGAGADSANGAVSTWSARPTGRTIRITQQTRSLAHTGVRTETFEAAGVCP